MKEGNKTIVFITVEGSDEISLVVPEDASVKYVPATGYGDEARFQVGSYCKFAEFRACEVVGWYIISTTSQGGG